jgi:hypothetical protein
MDNQNIKPKVFPITTNQQKIPQPIIDNKPLSTDQIEELKIKTVDEIFTKGLETIKQEGSSSEIATELMRQRVAEQLELRKQGKPVVLDIPPPKSEQLERPFIKQPTQINNEVKDHKSATPQTKQYILQPQMQTIPSQPTETDETERYINEISQPQYNGSFDLVPIPSEGKLYKNKKKALKVGFLTTADEDILTSPHLLQSGKFLEILINRKLLEPDLRYKDLHIGDRNAIMLWLRGTAYGEMYPITILDENDNPFDTEISLNILKVKNLGVEPDVDGLFPFQLRTTGDWIRFKLLTVADVDYVDELLAADKENGLILDKSKSYKLGRLIVEVNGNRDPQFISEYVERIRILDGKELRKYVDDIESGVDLNIEVGTPGGGSVRTFLPLNLKFFWPDIKL